MWPLFSPQESSCIWVSPYGTAAHWTTGQQLMEKVIETPVLVQKKSKNHRKQWVTFQKKGYPRVSLQKRYIFFAFFSWMEANTKQHKVRVMNASCSPSACSCSPVKHKKLRLFCRLTQLLRSNLCLWALFPILQKNFFLVGEKNEEKMMIMMPVLLIHEMW